MDTLYIGDIPQEYHYALFNNGYIDLFNTANLTNGTYNYYRIYTNCGGFYYDYGNRTFSQYNNTIANNINVTDNQCYRNDFPSILFMTLAFTIIGVWLLNLLSSIVRKGGMLGGLL